MHIRDRVESSGNVFADLHLPQADDLLAKAELAAKIIAEIQRRRMTQAQAAAVLAIDQPKISALKQGKLSPRAGRCNLVPMRTTGRRRAVLPVIADSHTDRQQPGCQNHHPAGHTFHSQHD